MYTYCTNPSNVHKYNTRQVTPACLTDPQLRPFHIRLYIAISVRHCVAVGAVRSTAPVPLS